MTASLATIIILPLVRGFWQTLDAVEQRDREIGAQLEAQRTAPPRTRPLLVVSRASAGALPFPNFRSAACRMAAEATGGGCRKPGIGHVAGRSPIPSSRRGIRP